MEERVETWRRGWRREGEGGDVDERVETLRRGWRRGGERGANTRLTTSAAATVAKTLL